MRIRTTKDIINGKVGFKLEVGEYLYSVEIHPRLNTADGVAYPCEPDFLISLDRESDAIPPVAVFLDGYRYHKDKVQEDLMKRQGIFLASDRLTWSLTWHDINHVFAGSEVKVPNVFREHIQNGPKAFIRQVSEQKGLTDYHRITELSPLLMLLKFLSRPSREQWRGYAALQALSWLDQQTMQDKNVLDELKAVSSSWPSQFVDQLKFADVIFCSINKIEDEAVKLTVYIAGGAEAIKTLDSKAFAFCVVYQPLNTAAEVTHRTWQKLLQMVNLGQFLPYFFAATKQGISDGSFSKLAWGVKPKTIRVSAWDKVFELADEDVTELLAFLASQNVPIPEVGYELVDAKGVAIGECELAWEALKVAVLLDEQMDESKTPFANQGWQVFTLADDQDVIRNAIFEKIGRQQ